MAPPTEPHNLAFDPFPTSLTPSPTVGQGQSTAPAFVDFRPISPAGLIIAKTYAYGGIVFMGGVILTCITMWTWIVVIKRDFAASPPELEVYPELAEERRKRRQEKKDRRREESLRRAELEAEKGFVVPPLRFPANLFRRRSSLPSYNGVVQNTHPRSRSASVSTPRKSSIASRSRGLSVTWASSNRTLNENGEHGLEPLSGKEEDEGAQPNHLPADWTNDPNSMKVPPRSLPPFPQQASLATPRSSTSITLRSPRGRQMIAQTTPDVAEEWSKPAAPQGYGYGSMFRPTDIYSLRHRNH